MPAVGLPSSPETPVPPANVRLHPGGADAPDAAAVPVDCLYVGLIDGVHVWEVIVPDGLRLGRTFQVTVSVIPPRTSIRLPLPPQHTHG